MTTPNPLLCGCRVVEVTDETTDHFRMFHFAVKQCPLHAAAPDLLAALKGMLDKTIDHRAAFAMARAAIAKAEQPTAKGE